MADGQSDRPLTEFELRRAELVGQIGESLEQVLTQINALNRSMESIIEIGNEFASVEALWSQFENVMGSNGHQESNDETNNNDNNRNNTNRNGEGEVEGRQQQQ